MNAFPSIREGQTVAFEFTFSEADMAAFADLSGDYNPLHCDESFARSRGYGGRVVYGALTLAKVSRLIGMELPGSETLWNGVEMQFVSPLLVGEHATLEASVSHISPATSSIELRLRIRSGERTIARGKVFVSVRDGG